MRCVVALISLVLLAGCSLRPYSFERLQAGMTKDEVVGALGAPMTLVASRGAAEVYMVEQSAKIPWYFPSDEKLFLQFRRGQLSAWKGAWDIPPRWF